MLGALGVGALTQGQGEGFLTFKRKLKLQRRVSSVQSLSRVRLFATPWTAARQASLSYTNSQSLLKLMSIESVMPSSHLILCRPLQVAKVLELQLQHQSFK